MINTENIKSVLASNNSGGYIEEECGVSKMVISNYRTGKRNFDSMTLGMAKSLQGFYDAHKDEKAEPNVKINGIRLAVTAFNDWQGTARVYFDPTDMSVWTKVYANSDSWNEYPAPIVKIAAKESMMDRNNRISMRDIKKSVMAELSKDER